MAKKKLKLSSKKGIGKLLMFFVKIFRGIYHFIDKIVITPITKFILFISRSLKDSSKPFDRMLNNKIFLILFSLAIAFVTFLIVENTTDIMLNSSADVIYNKQVTALYNEEAYVVEGLPEVVDITLVGRRADLYLAKQYPTDEVVVDLRDLKPGTHKVNLKYSGSVSSVDYKLDPSTAAIVIYEKVSESRSITTEVLYEDKLNTKYTITNITPSREEVYIKGAAYKLEEVAIVKALVDVTKIVNPVVGTVALKEVPLVAYNSAGEKLDVEVVPATIDASIEITSPSKEVPFKVVPEGDIVFGKSLDTITLSENKVTIYGDTDVLANVSYIPVKIDVNGLSSNTEFNVNVSKPKGIREISVPAVVVKVTLNNEFEKTINNVSIESKNLGNGFVAQAASKNESAISVIVKGTSRNLDKVTADNITASVDLQGLGEGSHSVAVNVSGEDLKLTYKPKTTMITIVIRKQK